MVAYKAQSLSIGRLGILIGFIISLSFCHLLYLRFCCWRHWDLVWFYGSLRCFQQVWDQSCSGSRSSSGWAWSSSICSGQVWARSTLLQDWKSLSWKSIYALCWFSWYLWSQLGDLQQEDQHQSSFLQEQTVAPMCPIWFCPSLVVITASIP